MLTDEELLYMEARDRNGLPNNLSLTTTTQVLQAFVQCFDDRRLLIAEVKAMQSAIGDALDLCDNTLKEDDEQKKGGLYRCIKRLVRLCAGSTQKAQNVSS
jgi:hypothetical protein